MVKVFKLIGEERTFLGLLEVRPMDEMEDKLKQLDAEYSTENEYAFEKVTDGEDSQA